MPVIFMPSSPALVPELGRGDSDSQNLLYAARSVVGDMCSRHKVTSISLVGSTDHRNYTAHTGSFRAWGAPEVHVSGGNHLAELVMRYVIGPTQAPINAGELTTDPQVLNVVALDGPAGLTEKAPLALVPGAQDRHEWCQQVLAQQQVAWPATMEPLREDGIVEPEMWWLLRNLRGGGARLAAVSSAHGVGRYVASWEEVS